MVSQEYRASASLSTRTWSDPTAALISTTAWSKVLGLTFAINSSRSFARGIVGFLRDAIAQPASVAGRDLTACLGPRAKFWGPLRSNRHGLDGFLGTVSGGRMQSFPNGGQRQDCLIHLLIGIGRRNRKTDEIARRRNRGEGRWRDQDIVIPQAPAGGDHFFPPAHDDPDDRK